MASASEVAWGARWSALVDADYNHDFGLERHYRQNAEEWGYNLSPEQVEIDAEDGTSRPGRVFSNVGVVVYNGDDTIEVLGWPV